MLSRERNEDAKEWDYGNIYNFDDFCNVGLIETSNGGKISIGLCLLRKEHHLFKAWKDEQSQAKSRSDTKSKLADLVEKA